MNANSGKDDNNARHSYEMRSVKISSMNAEYQFDARKTFGKDEI